MEIINGFKFTGAILVTVLALAGCNDSNVATAEPYASSIPVDSGIKITVFTDELGADWSTYSCCDTEGATLVTDEYTTHNVVSEFSIGTTETTVGYAPESPIDISNITTKGTLDFDIKVVTAPTADGVVAGEIVPTSWILKFESNGGAYAGGEEIEIVISDLVVGTWKSISHPLSDLGNLDSTKVDNVLIFPVWGSGAGSVYRVDNVSFNENMDAMDPVIPEEVGNKINIFSDAVATNWSTYSCCATENALVITDEDATHGAVTQFSIIADTTVGYSTDSPIDITDMVTTGTLNFDLRVVTAPPADGVSDGEAIPTSWVIKFESNGGAYVGGEEVEVVITDLVVGTWKSISHPLNDLGTLDTTKIGKVLIFPAWGSGVGSVYNVDNVIFNESATN